MANNGSRGESRQSLVRGKGSKLRRAVTFFRQLGHKKDARLGRAGPSSLHIIDPCEDPLDAMFIKEMDGSSRQPAELANSDHKSCGDQPRNTASGQKVYEMDTRTQYMSILPNEMHMETEASLCELDTVYPSRPLQSSPGPNPSKTSLTCIGAQFDAGDYIGLYHQEETMVVSPISTDQDSTIHNINADPSPRDTVPLFRPTQASFESMHTLREVHSVHRQDTLTKALTIPDELLQAHEASGSPFDGNIQTTQSQVGEVRDLVHILNIEWIRRVNSTPNLDVAYSVYCVPSLFDTGAHVLQRCYENTYPNTFKEAFALMHVTCAIVYILRGDDPFYDWDVFFQDMLQWRHAMLEESDAWLLVKFVNILWSPEGSPTASDVINGGSPHHHKEPLAAMLPDPQADVRPHCALDYPKYIGNHPSVTQRQLKSGKVIKECSPFFYGMSSSHA